MLMLIGPDEADEAAPWFDDVNVQVCHYRLLMVKATSPEPSTSTWLQYTPRPRLSLLDFPNRNMQPSLFGTLGV